MRQAVVIVLLYLLTACAGMVDRSNTGTGDVLVDSEWLSENLNRPDLRIIELGSKRDSYDHGHIPGAQYVDWLEIIDPEEKERFNLISGRGMEGLLSRLGISPSDTIVLYDTLDARLSIRMYWSLQYYGHSKIKVLNGNKQTWSNAGKALVKDIPVYDRTSYRTGRINSGSKVGLDFIMENIDSEGIVIVDGRPPKQYRGEIAGVVFHTGIPHKRKGHIKGAVNVFWKDNFNSDGTFKSINELKALYEKRGITKDKTVITYCNEGLHAAPPWFVLTRLLGYTNVRVYDDSMSEWANRDDTPMEQGGAF